MGNLGGEGEFLGDLQYAIPNFHSCSPGRPLATGRASVGVGEPPGTPPAVRPRIGMALTAI
jgi:hypothetical protein